MVPCYSVCCLLPAVVNRCFLTTVSTPLPIPLGTTHSGCVVYSFRIRFILMAPNHEPLGLARLLRGPPGATCPPSVLQWSTPRSQQCFIDPSVARNTPRSSIRPQCQVFGCPPGLRPSLPAIVVKITRLGNRLLLCRATAAANK